MKTPASKNRSSSSESSFDPWIIWTSICRSWYWAAPIGLMLAGLAGFYVIQNFVPEYRASNILGVSKVSSIKGLGLLEAPRNLAKTESWIIKNDVVTRAVLTDPECVSYKLLSDPETAERNLLKGIRVVAAGSEDRMEISFVGNDPEKVTVICNALAKSYLRYREGADNKSVKIFEGWLMPAIEQQEEKVEDLKKQAEQLSMKSPMSGLRQNTKNDSQLDYITKLRAQSVAMEQDVKIGRAKLLTERDVAKSKLEELEKQFETGVDISIAEPTEQEILTRLNNDTELNRVKNEQQALHAYAKRMEGSPRLDKIRKAKERAWNADRAVETEKQLARQRAIVALKASAQRHQQSFTSNGESKRSHQFKQAKRQIAENLALAEKAQAELETRSSVVESNYQAENEILKVYSGDEQELFWAHDKYERANDVLDGLVAYENRVQANRQSAVIEIAPATQPKSPIEDLPYKKLAIACLAGFCVPFGLGLLLELRSQRLTNAAMCDRNGLSVIGEVSRLPTGLRSAKGKRVFEESVDALRANLFLSLETEKTRSIAVVSSMSGEGKSCVSSQIALSIAKATGKTVLLVDCDLRCPDQHEIFDLDIGPGLTSVLAGEVAFKDAVDDSLGDMLHVLTAGKLAASPHRLVSRESMAKFVEEALKEYEYVVIDTAPVLSAGESLAVASAVDATLLCVMRDFSRIDHVTRTTRRLEAAGVNIAGTIFSGISARGYAYRYGDYDYSSDVTVQQPSKLT